MQVIAILAIFFAIELEVSGLERMTTWVVVSYVGFHVVTHTLLTINMCWSDNTSDNMGSSSQIYPVTRYSGTEENDVFVDSQHCTDVAGLPTATADTRRRVRTCSGRTGGAAAAGNSASLSTSS